MRLALVALHQLVHTIRVIWNILPRVANSTMKEDLLEWGEVGSTVCLEILSALSLTLESKDSWIIQSKFLMTPMWLSHLLFSCTWLQMVLHRACMTLWQNFGLQTPKTWVLVSLEDSVPLFSSPAMEMIVVAGLSLTELKQEKMLTKVG